MRDVGDEGSLAWRSTGEIVGRGLRAAATMLWAQRLSAEAFGTLTHAWTVNLLLAQVFGLTLPSLLLKETAANPQRAGVLLADALRVRTRLVLPSFIVGALVVLTMQLPPPAYALLGLALALGALCELMSHHLIALGRWRQEAQVSLVGGVGVAGASLIAMALDGGVVSATASVVAGNAIAFVVGVAAVSSTSAFLGQRVGQATAQSSSGQSSSPQSSSPQSSSHQSRRRVNSPSALALGGVIPWAVLGVIEQLSYQLEILWLERAQSTTEVAHFSAMYRVLGLSGPLLIIANQLMLRRASQTAAAGGSLHSQARRALYLGFAVGMAGALGLTAASPFALPLIYPFANAHTLEVARMLSWLLVFWFACTGLVQVALGQGRVRMLIGWVTLQLCLQCVMSAWWVGAQGALGAARAQLLATGLSAAVLVVLMRRELKSAA